MDFTRASDVTPEVEAAVNDAFEDNEWDEEMLSRVRVVRETLSRSVLTIIRNVPPGPDRSAAIRKIREAHLDCNSAITHNGRY
jgi:hypothetical protein